jgi:protein-S-isoprenylcysteine O-methyltransferase Ste14
MSELWDRLPLPAEHAVAMLAGLMVQSHTRQSRLPAVLAPAGWPVLAAGVAINVWAVRARGSGDLEHPERLVTTGPYALARHPMYVGWSLLHLGTAITVRSPWVLLTWPVAFALVHRTVLREERLLAAQFGDALTDYSGGVPRYVPKIVTCGKL